MVDMFEVLSRFIEMRGISIISALLIIFLFKLDLDQRKQIKNLETDLTTARDRLDKRIDKYLEANNNLMLELKVDMGKMSEAIKGVCNSLDDVKDELRDKRDKR